MDRLSILTSAIVLTCIIQCHGEGDTRTLLSAILTPDKNSLLRQERSYYDRYGYGRPYDRFDDRPSRCGRCDDDDDDDDDYDRGRDRDDDRRPHRPTYGSRNDRNKYDDDDNRRYDNDRKNTTDGDNGDKKQYDDKDSDRPHRRRNKNRNRYDDRDRYRPDYYDRFLRDPYRDRYDDPYRRPSYDRYPYQDRYYDDYGGRGDGYYSYSYRRPLYEDRYDRGGGYVDAYGGYGPGVGRGPHDSFRPWDETYRGQAGWDSGGRGYYFASGRPDSTVWGQQQYARPATSGGGWQNVGYSTGYSGYSGYRDPGNRGSVYAGGYQDLNSGYGQSSGWRNVGERRPYRDQSGVAHLDTKITQEQDNRYGQNRPSYGSNTYQPGSYTQSSTTPGTSYLFQREDDLVTVPETTIPPS